MRIKPSYKASPFHVVDDVVLIEVNSKAGKAIYTEVDASDFFALNLWCYPFRSHVDGHVRTVENNKDVFLHNLIQSPKPGFVCDHIDGNPLNNRRSNLRHATAKENAWNRKTFKNSSGLRGVQRSPRYPDRPWRASFKTEGRHVLSKFFASKEEALAARIEAEKMYHGEFRRITT